MKALPASVLAALAPRFDAAADRLELLGGGQDFSDGTVFTFGEPARKHVLKVLGPFSSGDAAVDVAEARLACVARLADGATAALVRPVASRAGAIFERAEADGQVYLAYAYPFAPGRAAAATDAAVRSGAYRRARWKRRIEEADAALFG